jgi:5-methylcytosine-specific restriction endonuclease McrA
MTTLNKPTLVLNRVWQPIGVASVARSLTLVAADRARVVDPTDYQQYAWSDWAKLIPKTDEPFVQAVRFRLRVPEVIVLTAYDRVPATAVTFSRRNIFKRDHFTCQYCNRQGRSVGVEHRVAATGNGSRRERLALEDLTIDHVIPRSRGGTSTWENCVLACLDCNARKANRTPDEDHMPLRKPPVRPTWRPLYARHDARIESWSKFLSEAYWEVRLEP